MPTDVPTDVPLTIQELKETAWKEQCDEIYCVESECRGSPGWVKCYNEFAATTTTTTTTTTATTSTRPATTKARRCTQTCKQVQNPQCMCSWGFLRCGPCFYPHYINKCTTICSGNSLPADKHPSCPRWKGYCTRGPWRSWMAANCATTCGAV